MSKITFKEYSVLMNKIAYWIIKNNKRIKVRDVYNVGGTGVKLTTMKKKILADKGESNLKYGRRFTEDAVIDNKSYEQFPAYVTGTNGVKYYLNTYTDMAKRVKAYKKTHGKNPKKVKVQGTNNNNTTSKTTDNTLKKCYDAFGKFTSFDGFLEKIQGRGYAYYYNSNYNTDTTIKRIKNKQGVNCTDSTQLGYRVATALGYKDVQIIHVRCSQGDGHVRMRMRDKKTGEFFYRDPASVLNGSSIDSNWCIRGHTVLAYNPSWIFADIME